MRERTSRATRLAQIFCAVSSAIFITVALYYSYTRSQRLTQSEQTRAQVAKAHAEDEDRKFLEAKNRLYMRCRNSGDIPVMGFGLKVICVRAEAVAWEQGGLGE